MKFFISLIMLCIVNLFCRISGEFFQQCENLESGAFVGGTKGCQSYIYCDGEDSYEGVCPSQLLFNTKDGSCAPASEVDCADNQAGGLIPTLAIATTTTPIPTTKPTTTTTTTTTTTVTTTTKKSTAKPETTRITTSTASTTGVPATDAVDPEEEISEESHKEDGNLETVTKVTASVPLTTVFAGDMSVFTSSPTLSCPDTDRPNEVVFLPSEVSCSEYFVCYHGTPVPMSCSGQLFFDYLTSKCELPERVNCLIFSVSTPSPRKLCTANIFDFFPYPKNCNYFYKCINGFLSLQQCPIGFGWSGEMKLCVKLADGRCPIERLQQLQSYAWLNKKFHN